jgi:hypothetical protein
VIGVVSDGSDEVMSDERDGVLTQVLVLVLTWRARY